MEKILKITCWNCDHEFRVIVTLMEISSNKDTFSETLTKPCPKCREDNTVFLPQNIQSSNSEVILRGGETREG